MKRLFVLLALGMGQAAAQPKPKPKAPLPPAPEKSGPERQKASALRQLAGSKQAAVSGGFFLWEFPRWVPQPEEAAPTEQPPAPPPPEPKKQ